MLRRADVILIGALLLISIVIFAAFFTLRNTGNQAVVCINGTEVARYSLSKNLKTTVNTGNDGYNILVIQGGKVSISNADCRDLICVKQGSISKTGEMIVCLPHRFTVEIK